MYIRETRVTSLRYDPSAGQFVGMVTFHARDDSACGNGLAQFLCRARLDKTAPIEAVQNALRKEARRQCLRMPEYLLGQQTLSFAPDALPEAA